MTDEAKTQEEAVAAETADAIEDTEASLSPDATMDERREFLLSRLKEKEVLDQSTIDDLEMPFPDEESEEESEEEAESEVKSSKSEAKVEIDDLEAKIAAAIEKEKASREVSTKATAEQEELKTLRELWAKFNEDPASVVEQLVPDFHAKYTEHKDKKDNWSNLSPEQRSILELKKEIAALKEQKAAPVDTPQIDPETQKQINEYTGSLKELSSNDDYAILAKYCEAKGVDIVEEATRYAGDYMTNNNEYISPELTLKNMSDWVNKELDLVKTIDKKEGVAPKKVAKKVVKKKKGETLLNDNQTKSSNKVEPEDPDDIRRIRALKRLKQIEETKQ